MALCIEVEEGIFFYTLCAHVCTQERRKRGSRGEHEKEEENGQ